MDPATLAIILAVVLVLAVIIFLLRDYFTFLTPTVNKVAAVIDTDLKEGRLSNKTSRIVYRAGRSDGRRKVSPTSVEASIVSAIEAAGSILAEEYVDKVNGHKKQIEDLTAEADAWRKEADRAEGELPPEPGPADLIPDPEAPAPFSRPDLNLSIEKHKVANKNAELKAAAEAEHAKWEEGKARVRKLRDDADRNDEQVEGIQKILRDLGPDYAQRWLSTKKIGEFVWNRYVGGYHFGARKDAQASSVVKPEITFDAPNPWASTATNHGKASE